MTSIRVSRDVNAPPEEVWKVLADLAGHARWMKDVEWMVTIPADGPIGTRMVVGTRIGPFRTTDILEITGWDEGHSIDAIHHGLVKGEGTLSVTPGPSGSVVTWEERLRFPWWLGGPVTARLARPVLRRVWRGNLDRLSELVRDLQ